MATTTAAAFEGGVLLFQPAWTSLDDFIYTTLHRTHVRMRQTWLRGCVALALLHFLLNAKKPKDTVHPFEGKGCALSPSGVFRRMREGDALAALFGSHQTWASARGARAGALTHEPTTTTKNARVARPPCDVLAAPHSNKNFDVPFDRQTDSFVGNNLTLYICALFAFCLCFWWVVSLPGHRLPLLGFYRVCACACGAKIYYYKKQNTRIWKGAALRLTTTKQPEIVAEVGFCNAPDRKTLSFSSSPTQFTTPHLLSGRGGGALSLLARRHPPARVLSSLLLLV